MKKPILCALVLVMMAAWLSANSAMAATPPLLPFDSTGDLYVMDEGCDCILRITPGGLVSVEVTKADITTATGESPDLDHNGIAFDAGGAMYFTEDDSNTILKKSGGVLSVLTTEAAIKTATGASSADPTGLAFGSDGFLYVADDDVADALLRVDPSTGAVSVYVTKAAYEAALGALEAFDMEIGVAADEDGNIYTTSHGGTAPIGGTSPQVVFKVVPTVPATVPPTGTPTVLASSSFESLSNTFMTRDAGGDLVVSDRGGPDHIHGVTTPGGAVSSFLTNAELEVCAGVDLEGGIAFDDAGIFYVADEDDDSIYKFDTSGVSPTCELFVSDGTMAGVSGSSTDLEAGIAFGPGPTDISGKFPALGPGDTTTSLAEGGCAEGTAFTFSVMATFENISTDTLSGITFEVTTLTGGNVLCNADDGPGGVGSTLTVPLEGAYSDGFLSPEESFDVGFEIGLVAKAPFGFNVEPSGVVGP